MFGAVVDSESGCTDTDVCRRRDVGHERDI